MPTHILRQGDTIRSLAGWSNLQGLGVGNVYRVIKSDEAYYSQFIADYQGEYSDGSLIVHPDDGSGDGIQSALDACVECRNDYVIVQPSDSDYDLTAALTMSKKSVHLICPAGLGNDVGSNNSVRLHQNTDGCNVIDVSDTAVEIAGFYFKNYQNHSHIALAATSYAPNIHHNTFTMNITSTTAEPVIAGTGDAGAWGSIERNWIISYAGNDATIAKIIDIKSSATSARVCFNEITIGDGTIATVGISNAATKGMVRGNVFGGAGSDCTWTHCIAIGSYGNAVGNRGVVATSELITGGEQHNSCSDNMDGTNGGVIDDGEA